VGDSAAERKRRSRAHQRGDHSLCIPGRCEDVTPQVTVEEPRHERDSEQVSEQVSATHLNPRGPELGPSGSALWLEMTKDGQLPALQAVLLLEACRIADRLDKLDAQLRGEDWLRFLADEAGSEVSVVVDKVLAEARQQATALKQIVAELRTAAGKPASKTPRAPSGSSAKGGAGIADITARIAERRAAPSG
jgi:hypothetical protein